MRRATAGILIAAASIWSWLSLDIQAADLARGASNAGTLIGEMFPPYGIGSNYDPDFLRSVGGALLETFHIAILATLIGAILSLPLAVLCARTLFPDWLTTPMRLLAAAVRVLPSILWAILMVILVGLGPLAGVAAMALYSTGYLMKLQYETFEGLPRDSQDAVRAMGAGSAQVAWHVVLPEAGNALRSQLLFMFEYNVRASSIIGVVGAGGLGQLLNAYFRFHAYDKVLAVLIVLFAAVVALDGLSYIVRRRFLDDDHEKPKWREVLVPWKGTLAGPK